jgi:hypothetical protein
LKKQDFSSRSAALIWIIDNQNARGKINEITRAYIMVDEDIVKEKAELERIKYNGVCC